MISEKDSKVITGVFKNRWRTLMSVDDVIDGVIKVHKDVLCLPVSPGVLLLCS